MLAAHALANAEENVVGVVGGADVSRDRDAEFSTDADAATLRARAADVVERMRRTLAALDPADLSSVRQHPRRGSMPAREVLLVAARHAAEHMGHAELTRDLIRAGRPRT